MSSIGSSVARRAISMAGGRGTGTDHARRTGRLARRGASQDVLNRPTLKGQRAGEAGAWARPWACERSVAMSKSDGVFIYIGTYASEVDARADYDVVKDLHAVGAVGTYDAAVVTKDDKGKIHVNKDETTTRHGAWGGAAAGALVGILFPPSIIGTAIVGAAVGGVSGHLWKGMSRTDVKEFGEAIDAGEAALVIVGETTIEDAIEKATLKAEKKVAKELQVDKKDVDQAVQEAAQSLS
jgi:uncharacterized membrane protein